MDSGQQGKKTVVIRIDEDLFCKLMELHISPQVVAKSALKAEVQRKQHGTARKERVAGLRAVQSFDPRVTAKELKSSSPRVRRLRRMASVYEPSIGV